MNRKTDDQRRAEAGERRNAPPPTEGDHGDRSVGGHPPLGRGQRVLVEFGHQPVEGAFGVTATTTARRAQGVSWLHGVLSALLEAADRLVHRRLINEKTSDRMMVSTTLPMMEI